MSLIVEATGGGDEAEGATDQHLVGAGSAMETDTIESKLVVTESWADVGADIPDTSSIGGTSALSLAERQRYEDLIAPTETVCRRAVTPPDYDSMLTLFRVRPAPMVLEPGHGSGPTTEADGSVT